MPVCFVLRRLFSPPLHQQLMAFHAEDALRRPRVFEILNLLLAIPTAETRGAEGLLAGQDGEIFDFVPTGGATVGAIVADEGAVAEEEQVGVRIEEGRTRMAAEAVNMPAVSSCPTVSLRSCPVILRGGHTQFKGLSFLQYLPSHVSSSATDPPS